MRSPRERMVVSAALFIRERGAHATAISGALETERSRLIDRVCEPSWHTLGTTGVRLSNPIKSLYHAELHKYWWARTVSNRRPLVCKTRALPLSYAPVPRKDTAPTTQRPKR